MANLESTRDACEQLKVRFTVAGSPGGEFRPRTRRAKGGEGWTEMVCVDARGQVILGVKAVRFRPTITGTTVVLPLEQQGTA